MAGWQNHRQRWRQLLRLRTGTYCVGGPGSRPRVPFGYHSGGDSRLPGVRGIRGGRNAEEVDGPDEVVTGNFPVVHKDRAGDARHRNILPAVVVALLPSVGEVGMRKLPSRGMDSVVVVAVVDSLDKKSAMAVLQMLIREAPGW